MTKRNAKQIHRPRRHAPFGVAGLALAVLLLDPTLSYAQVCTGDVALFTQAEVDSFAGTEVTGDLTIAGTEIDNLNARAGLASVERDLFIVLR